MVDDDTLLAHLVPTLTSRHEDTATEALAFILNKSRDCRNTLDRLIGVGSESLQPIARLQTQVQYDDGCRPDMVGYLSNGDTQLIVESKFWAGLLPGQASGYIQHLDDKPPGVLLFICPDARIDSLWSEVLDQMRQKSHRVLVDPVANSKRIRRASVEGMNNRIVLISWGQLLDTLNEDSTDPGVQSDIRQLQGLAQTQDDEAFQPLQADELDTHFARRIRHFNRIVDSAVDSGHRDEWLSVTGFQATSRPYGYGRWFRFKRATNASWFGVNHYRWGAHGRTPLWVRIHEEDMWLDVGDSDVFKVRRGNYWWVPVRLKTGVMFDLVLDDVTSELKAIGDTIGEAGLQGQ